MSENQIVKYRYMFNLPGCIPESTPAEFDSAREAWEYAYDESFYDPRHMPENSGVEPDQYLEAGRDVMQQLASQDTPGVAWDGKFYHEVVQVTYGKYTVTPAAPTWLRVEGPSDDNTFTSLAGARKYARYLREHYEHLGVTCAEVYLTKDWFEGASESYGPDPWCMRLTFTPQGLHEERSW